MNIDSIRNGIVLDHITAGKSMEIYRYLKLDELDCSVAIIKNVTSRKKGKKDIIKIDENFDVNLDVLGYLDPGITVCYIQNSQIVKKTHVEIPETITNIIRCKNPRCITTVEQSIDHIFRLTDPVHRTYRCIYCEGDKHSFL